MSWPEPPAEVVAAARTLRSWAESLDLKKWSVLGITEVGSSERVVLDCLNKGYEVTFKGSHGLSHVWCCIERQNQFTGAKPFSMGLTLEEAAVHAARYASVPGY